jgi:hypothetical protein
VVVVVARLDIISSSLSVFHTLQGRAEDVLGRERLGRSVVGPLVVVMCGERG